MRKFDDVLRIISGVLLGVLVRDIDKLRGSVAAYILARDTNVTVKQTEYVTAAISFVLVAAFLRNIHGSARWDEAVEQRGYIPNLENCVFGRMLLFLLAVLGLFLGPYLAAHVLAHHLEPGDEVSEAAAYLLTPFVIYLAWNFLLWLSDPDKDPDSPDRPAVDEIVQRWLKIDAVGLSIVLALIGYGKFLEAAKPPMPGQFMAWTVAVAAGKPAVSGLFMAWAFVLFAAMMTFWDYFANRYFYFPPVAPLQPSARPGPVAPAPE